MDAHVGMEVCDLANPAAPPRKYAGFTWPGGLGASSVNLSSGDALPADRASARPELELVQAPYLSCDVPALHPEVAAYPEPGGGTALVCPYCGRQHRHGGFGHRLAHCADPRGRGYALVPAVPPAPWAARQPSGGGARPRQAAERDYGRPVA